MSVIGFVCALFITFYFMIGRSMTLVQRYGDNIPTSDFSMLYLPLAALAFHLEVCLRGEAYVRDNFLNPEEENEDE